MKRILLLLVALITLGADAVMAQGRHVTGRVLDESGQGLPGAGITVRGTQVGTVSDLDGNFQLNVPDGSNVLVVQAIGYGTQEVPVGSGTLVVRMSTATKELQGAVVTALAIRREKRDLGYSATTINSDELNNGNSVNPLQAITGKTAGANITNTTGAPGGSTRVVLRGEKSISGTNNALIVVDGIPINNGSRLAGASSLEQIDFGNRGVDINPEDIESISVLKGPAAAALYGSAGANGAIMITTKSGRSRNAKKKTEISYNFSYQLSDILKYPKFQNEFGEGDVNNTPNDRRENFSWGLPFDGHLRPWGQIINGQQLVKPYSAQPDNVKSFFDLGKTTENNVSIGGGGDNGNYFVAFNTLKNTGVVPNDFYNRYGVRFNGSTQLGNHFYSSINLNYLNIASRTNLQGQAQGAVWGNLLQTPRDIPVWELKNLSNPFYGYNGTDAEGNSKYGYYGAYTENPYYLAQYYDNEDRTDRVLGAITVGYKPNDHFNIYNRIGGDIISDRVSIKTPKYDATSYDPFFSASRKTNPGGYYEGTTNSQSFYNDLIANYTRDLNNDITLTALLGNNIQYSRSNLLSGEINYKTNGLVIPGFYNLSNGTGPVTDINSLTESFTTGVYGSLRLDYRRRLFLELTARNDWSSTLFQPGINLVNTSFFYPSANVSYVFTEGWRNHFTEKILTYGKLRASIASVGNGAPAYANNPPGFIRTTIGGNFGTLAQFPFSNIPGYAISNTLATNLRPERTNAWEVGAELGFFKDRLNVDFTYYYNTSIDQILPLPIPTSTGFSYIYQNVGDIVNKGIELAVRATPISTRTGFRWEIYGTYTKNTNEVQRLSSGVSQVTVGGYSDMAITATVGKPFGSFYAIDFERDRQGHVVVDSASGLPKAATDATYQGSYQPKFIASWGTTLRYKRFVLNVLFTTKQGGKFYSDTKRTMDFVGTAAETAFNDRQPYVMPNSVYQKSDGTYVANTDRAMSPYLYYTSILETNVSAAHILDASYVKVQEASFSYTFPDKWLGKSPFSNLTLGIFGNNLFIWAKNDFVDPEVNAGGATNEQGFDYTARPSLRNYGFRLGVNF